MEGQELTNITVLIAGRSYPLKVKEEDAARIRDIVKEVNEKIDTFQKTYSRKDKQDCLSMALLTYAVDFHKVQPTHHSGSSTDSDNNEELAKKIDQLDELVDFLLQ